MNDFKNKNFELRKNESDIIFKKYPKSIPIIIYSKYDDISTLKKHKYIVPNTLLCAHFFDIIRKQLNMSKEKALFFFDDNNRLLSATFVLSDIYSKNKNLDGFLYVYYSFENVFGSIL